MRFLLLVVFVFLSLVFIGCGGDNDGSEGSSCSDADTCNELLFCNFNIGECQSYIGTWDVCFKSAAVASVDSVGDYWDAENDLPDLGAWVTAGFGQKFLVPAVENVSSIVWGDEGCGNIVIGESADEIRFVLYDRDGDLGIGIYALSFGGNGGYPLYANTFDKLFSEQGSNSSYEKDGIISFKFSIKPQF